MDLVLSQYLDDLVTPLGVLIANNFERVLSWKYIPPLTQNVLRFLNTNEKVTRMAYIELQSEKNKLTIMKMWPGTP